MTRTYATAAKPLSYKAIVSLAFATSIAMTGCTTNYLTNSTEGTYGVPVTERTIPQRLLDRSIEHTAKINVYGLQENLQQTSRMSIDSFNSEVLLTGEVPTETLKTQVEKVISSMPDVRAVYNELNVGVARGYSSTVQDGYITSKLVAKAAANDGVKASQIKAVSNNGVVYLMGRLTPTQQSHLIDIANGTVGVTELVLLTTVVDDRGIKISRDDIMYEANLATDATSQMPAQPIVRQLDTANRVNAPVGSVNTSPVPSTNQTPVITQSPSTQSPETQSPTSYQNSSSPYIDLYKDQ
ncbi:BON domain-containing protein [uncultured Psychrobacter sp.]|uniref:BON domain-containing protein n=2 Tax=unclassified Psychrobacter TaxID=196806 RepID=UPI00293D980B|nr:BON domain-containing protein [uncultured Psychrobacter sp.]